MASRAAMQDPLKTFAWKVYVNGFLRMTFTECSGLSSKIEEVTYAEGGMDTDQKSPGRKKFDDITLKAGLFSPQQPGADDMFDWAVRIHELGQVGTLIEFRENIEIAMHDNYDVECIRYEVRNAWPKEWTPVPTLNTSSEVAYETIVLAHEGFKRINPV